MIIIIIIIIIIIRLVLRHHLVAACSFSPSFARPSWPNGFSSSLATCQKLAFSKIIIPDPLNVLRLLRDYEIHLRLFQELPELDSYNNQKPKVTRRVCKAKNT